MNPAGSLHAGRGNLELYRRPSFQHESLLLPHTRVLQSLFFPQQRSIPMFFDSGKAQMRHRQETILRPPEKTSNWRTVSMGASMRRVGIGSCTSTSSVWHKPLQRTVKTHLRSVGWKAEARPSRFPHPVRHEPMRSGCLTEKASTPVRRRERFKPPYSITQQGLEQLFTGLTDGRCTSYWQVQRIWSYFLKTRPNVTSILRWTELRTQRSDVDTKVRVERLTIRTLLQINYLNGIVCRSPPSAGLLLEPPQLQFGCDCDFDWQHRGVIRLR